MGGGRRSNRLQSGDDSSLELLHRAPAGDAEAREQFYRRLLPIMRCWARNQIRIELRRLYHDPERAEELPEGVPDDAPSPYENTVSDESRERYELALAELPEAERAMVVSRVEFGLSWHDIAELSGKPTADAARMAVSRALV